MFIDEAFESDGFWILLGIGIGAEVIGFIAARRFGWGTFPIWQFILLLLGTFVACAFFATRD